MLQTLLKIGEWQSRGKSRWDRFLEIPESDTEDKHGSSITNYTLSIIFDLDNQEVIIDGENLKEYDESDAQETLPIKLKGPKSKKIATALPGNKLDNLYLSFFGKPTKNTQSGQLKEAIRKDFPDLLKGDLKEILDQIFALEDLFNEKTEFTTRTEKKEINVKEIEQNFDLGRNENIVFLICKVKASAFGLDVPTPFSAIGPYKEFLEKTYFPQTQKEGEKTHNSKKLCYASGEVLEDVKELNLTERYSLNKMFVTETKNYASGFKKDQFNKNYQVSAEHQNYLDYASDFLLKQGFTVKIANVPHVIIPQFREKTDVNLEMALEGIQRKSDLLFNLNRLDYISKIIQDELEEDEVFWLNFFAYESDGNFFKSTEIIKDVSSFHFNNLIDAFVETEEIFRNHDFTNWDALMTRKDYDTKERVPHSLNFNSLYEIIPLRKNKEKKNKALELFKTILENRKVEQDLLYDYFIELILCHYYERYNSYTNTGKYGKDYFYFAVRDGVFKYLAFFEFLKKLNLIDMEETKTNPEKTGNQYDKVEQDFFDQMNFTQGQRAMFYLGRMLNRVEYLQEGKNKTVIQKVNFNGMDRDNIERLRIDLIEKAKQYNAVNKVIFIDNKFGQEFNLNEWSLSPQQAVFFLLTGYSFGAGKKNVDTENQNESY